MSHISKGDMHAYLDGALGAYPEEAARHVREHLDACRECAQLLEGERRLRQGASTILAVSAQDRWNSIHSRICWPGLRSPIGRSRLKGPRAPSGPEGLDPCLAAACTRFVGRPRSWYRSGPAGWPGSLPAGGRSRTRSRFRARRHGSCVATRLGSGAFGT